MKSCKVLLIAVCSFVFLNLNAQIFVGGSAGFSSFTTDYDGITALKSSGYDLNLWPKAGKFVSEELAIGLALKFSKSGSKADATDTFNKSTGFGVNPFLRYYAVKWNNFSIYGQGNLGIEYSASSVETGGNTTDGPKQTVTYLNMFPGLAYDISERFSLETSINILSLGYSYRTIKAENSIDKRSSFNVGAGLSNIVSLNAITIGALYKF